MSVSVLARFQQHEVPANVPCNRLLLTDNFIATFPSAPVKDSGFGSNNAGHGIEEFLLKKSITMDLR